MRTDTRLQPPEVYGAGLKFTTADRTIDSGPRPAISVIVPVHNGAETLGWCLGAIGQSIGVDWECIVIDDGSSDDSAEIARAWGAHVLHTPAARTGPAQARNIGAAAARGALLCFVDADVVIRPDTLANFVAIFQSDPELVAAFGSYDAEPRAPGVLSQYRNLLHHFIHQNAHEAATTFWAGCGVIRRSVFLAVGGFDPRCTHRIEDIELGYRLHAAGARIRLVKHIQVTHLKEWNLWTIIRTDIRDRALPWSALIARTRHLPNDLNLTWSSRVSATAVLWLATLLVLGRWQPLAWLMAVIPSMVLLVCNWRLYAFFLRERGLIFVLRVIPVHWLYFAYSSATFAGCMLVSAIGHRLGRGTNAGQ
jgi:GT2 family glycosyltransferase